jgi:hypothetical protein
MVELDDLFWSSDQMFSLKADKVSTGIIWLLLSCGKNKSNPIVRKSASIVVITVFVLYCFFSACRFCTFSALFLNLTCINLSNIISRSTRIISWGTCSWLGKTWIMTHSAKQYTFRVDYYFQFIRVILSRLHFLHFSRFGL